MWIHTNTVIHVVITPELIWIEKMYGSSRLMRRCGNVGAKDPYGKLFNMVLSKLFNIGEYFAVRNESPRDPDLHLYRPKFGEINLTVIIGVEAFKIARTQCS